MERCWAIVAAAGRGERLGGGGAKSFRPLAGLPLLAHVLIALAKSAPVEAAVVAVVPGSEGRVAGLAAEHAPAMRVEAVAGGPTRQASVRAALGAVPPEVDAVVVHDAARPLVGPDLVRRVLDALGEHPGAVCALPVGDTLKRVEGGAVAATVAREGLWQAQTPQAFRADALRRAHERAAAEGVVATDDAVLLERLGERVAVVPGDPRNIKVATPEDLALAEALLAGR